MYLSENLKIIRQNVGYSQMDIAQKIDIKRTTYQAYEDGRSEPDITTLQRISNLYGIPVDFLIREKLSEVSYDLEKGKVKLTVIKGKYVDKFEIRMNTTDNEFYQAQKDYLNWIIDNTSNENSSYKEIIELLKDKIKLLEEKCKTLEMAVSRMEIENEELKKRTKDATANRVK